MAVGKWVVAEVDTKVKAAMKEFSLSYSKALFEVAVSEILALRARSFQIEHV
jgi:hypothetical protein